MVVLVTYLPFHRIHEVSEYFVKNIEILKPRNAIVYVDNVYHEKQREIINNVMPSDVEVRVDNWRNRNNTWLAMLKSFLDINDIVIVVDSDVTLIESFIEKFDKMLSLGKMIGVEDIKIGLKPRDIIINGIPYTKIIYYKHGYSPIFFGPKQAVIINHKVDADAVAVLERALCEVPISIRNCIADEVILGLYALLIGQKLTPWFNGAINEERVRSDSCNKHLRAYAHYKLFNALSRNNVRVEGLRLLSIKIRYLFSTLVSW